MTFSGSKIHYIDYARDAFADFMGNDSAASDMVEGSGFLFNRVFNLFGEEVLLRTTIPKIWQPSGAIRPCLPVHCRVCNLSLRQTSTTPSAALVQPANRYGKVRASAMTSG